MPSSIVSICNQALGKLGAQPIIDILDDTRNGRAMNRLFDAKRDLEQSLHPWVFALAHAQIPAITQAPAFDWARSFPRPSGCLRIVQLGSCWVLYQDDGMGPGFELEGDSILTDEASPLNIRYTQRVTNTGLFPAPFVEVLVCRLAFEACKEITGSSEMRDQLWQERAAALAEARRLNAIEKPPGRPVRGSWVRALKGYLG
jgi:hypothetical protein